MATDNELIAEIVLQLKSDILSYGWLRQIVRLVHPTATSNEVTLLVENAVRVLLEANHAMLGDAIQSGGRVIVHPWSTDTEECLARLREVISTTSPDEKPEDRYTFWLVRKSS